MNDPTKRIDVEKSSLLSLKAELLRKQEEVLKNKKDVPFVVKTKLKNSKSESKPLKQSGVKIIESEDSSLIAKSQKILEAKAKYYERMVKMGGTEDENSMVMFNRKSPQRRQSSSDEDELVDYTDVFGRSRKITRRELRRVKEQDEQLTEIAESRDQQQTVTRDSSSSSSSGELSNESEGEIGPDIGLAFLEQKKQWEKQEELNKERTSLHYQDVLFDEARQHGVGFYEFSTDHEEREKQQEALNKIREETLSKQQERENLKKTRDSLIANRVKAAKARVRARLGLPEEVEEEKKDDSLYDTTDKKKEKEEAAAKKKAELEKEKERERQKHVRPWDKSKISSKNRRSSSESEEEKEWKPQRERYVMTQDEWNEKKRLERNQDFAPMNFVKSNEVFHLNDVEEPNKSLFFTSKKLKRRNQEVETESEARGVAIPPPATFDYYGPSTSAKQPRPPPANLEASISAGLKFLREQVDKGNKFKFGASSEYKETS